jgi:hypothetical protein
MHRSLVNLLCRITLIVATATLLLSAPIITVTAIAQTEAPDPDLLVYHQITNLGDDFLGVASPQMSSDGTTIAFADPFGGSDPEKPNRVFVIDADGGDPTEVDSYRPNCGCPAHIAISADGSVVVSTDSMQVRIADGGGARELLSITSNEIGGIRLSADGETAFFLVRRDVAAVDGTLLTRGVWAIGASGDNLRQIVAADDIADLFGIAIEATGCCFYADGMPFDVSASGDEIVFGAYAGDGEHVLAVSGDGSNLHDLAGPFNWVKNVAVSGDGSTVAFDIVPLDNGNNEVGLVDFAGGDPQIIATATGSSSHDVLRLSDDGSKLLLTPLSHLVDTSTGDRRQLAVLTPGAGGHDALLAEGMARAAMNADATRFSYVMRYIRCADCANLHEQIATLDIGPAALGAAPALSDATIDPTEIADDSVEVATASVAVETEGEIVAVGAVFLRDGVYDVNLAFDAKLLDDGLTADARANDDIFTNGALRYSQAVAREDDTGPRSIRYQAEIETPDGLRHATALDAGTLTVTAAE